MNTSAPDPLIGRTVDSRYLIEDRIARGGMAAVYRGLDYRLERPVAVKIMHPHLAEDEGFTQRFIQEARQAARLSHPNIVNVFDQGQDGALTFIVMEYLPGITLRELLKDFRSLTWEQTLDVIKAILQGLDAAHSAGIVHRDLKPENVLLADDGRIKIADFGLARAASHNTQTGQALLGTVAYLSPELVTGAPADVRSDLYAVGIMVFELLTGRQPFTGDQAVTIAYQHANGVVPAPSSVNPSVPPELDDFVRWCTEREPGSRPPHARAALEQVMTIERQIRQRTAADQPTQALTIAQTRVMAPRVDVDEQPTEVLSREEDIFAGLEPSIQQVPVAKKSAVASASAPSTRKPGPILWASIAVAVAVIVGIVWWAFAPKAPGQVTIEDVRGLTVDQAREVLEGQGLIVAEEAEEAFDAEVPVGLAVGTNPPAGELLNEGDSLSIVVSLGLEQTALPPLVGLPLADAQDRLDEAGLTLGAVEEEFSDTSEAGTVMRVLGEDDAPLAPNTELAPETTVNLVVSAGPLPQVVGLSVEEAEALLDAAGITAVVGATEYSDEVPEGFVIGVTNPQGTVLQPGDSVTLTVSRGPELIAVPDVINRNILVAVDVLETDGFVVEVDSEFPEDLWGEPFARVTSMDPSAGQQLPKGSVVTLRSFVSAGGDG